MPTLIDECMRERLTIVVELKLHSTDVIEMLAERFAREDCQNEFVWTIALGSVSTWC